ncbi:MAG: hypothetical protein L3J39_17350 [Verrucomicrobiales bacterium]|nr:hypothetical protein [Verrucomicrobiales bacterium]
MMVRPLQLLTTGLLTLTLFTQSLAACINTSYSRLDEVEITDDLLPLILGSFPHHGDAFYEHEILRTKKILVHKPDNFEARNDLGAAYTKLGHWSLAQSEFEKNEKLHPGRYETASNLGVMFKKKGDYKQAGNYIKKALEIKPGGHMGLGDYYLKMIQWLKNIESADIIEKNFLGIRYDAGPEATARVANEEYVVTLIKNDYQYADAYIVLGDILFAKGSLQLALRAYLRVSSLPGEPSYIDWTTSQQRIREINKIWSKQKNFLQISDRFGGQAQVQQEFKQAQDWLLHFQEVEADLISKDNKTPFAATLAEMKSRGITRATVIQAGTYKGFAYDITSLLFILAIGLAITAYIISFILRRRRRTRHP